MNLYAKLLERKEKPLRIGLIGAGKFAAMYIAQVPKTPGVHLVGIADIAPDYAKGNLDRVGWKTGTVRSNVSRPRAQGPARPIFPTTGRSWWRIRGSIS